MNSLTSLLIASLTVYVMTKVLTESHAAKGVRRLFREVVWEVLPLWLAKHFVRWFDDPEWEDAVKPVLEDAQEMDLTQDRELHGFDMISCPLCSGFYVTILVCACSQLPMAIWLAVYGLAVFLTTQER